MQINLSIASIWILLGSIITFLIDRSEMKKQIPYGEMLALPLAWLRASLFVIGTLICPVILLAVIVKGLYLVLRIIAKGSQLYMYWQYSRWYLRRTLRKRLYGIIDDVIEE